MAKSTAKKSTAPRKAKTSATVSQVDDTESGISVGEKSCAYPSCSARATQEFGDNKVPSCDRCAPIFENESNDGAGIQQLVENYKG